MALDRTKLPDFIQINPEEDLKLLKLKFEHDTDSTLSDAQLESIMISLMVYYMTLTKLKFNEAARLNLVQFSRYPIVDFIGELFNCFRLVKRCGETYLKVMLKTSFDEDLTLPKGLEVQSKDEKYVFTTVEDLVIPSGDLYGIVKIRSNDACADVNKYQTGDINILLKPFTYIESVTNTENVTGGADEESDEAYIDRIIESAEGFSCAGSKGAYEYFAKSAHPDIIDAYAKCEQKPASIIYNNETEVFEAGNVIEAENFHAEVDYFRGKMDIQFTVGDTVIPLIIKIPPAALVEVFPLTKSGDLPETIKIAVETTLAEDKVRPMTDLVKVKAPTVVSLTRKLNIFVHENADFEAVKKSAYQKIEEYRTSLRSELGAAYITNGLLSILGNTTGVYNIRPDSYDDVYISENEYINLNIEAEFKQ